MAIFRLTAGADTVTGTGNDDTVYGELLTLNAGDRLTGGAGTDTLVLNGSGTLRVDQLASFTGFVSITLQDFAGGFLYLGSQSISVTGWSGWGNVVFGSGAVTLRAGGVTKWLSSAFPSNWNAGNSIDGGPYGTSLYLN